MEKFEQTYSYKLIYVFSMPYETHKGMLKVGEATLKTDIMPNELVPNCHTLNQAAKARIGWPSEGPHSRPEKDRPHSHRARRSAAGPTAPAGGCPPRASRAQPCRHPLPAGAARPSPRR